MEYPLYAKRHMGYRDDNLLCTDAATSHVGTRRLKEFKSFALGRCKLGFTLKADLLKSLSCGSYWFFSTTVLLTWVEVSVPKSLCLTFKCSFSVFLIPSASEMVLKVFITFLEDGSRDWDKESPVKMCIPRFPYKSDLF